MLWNIFKLFLMWKELHSMKNKLMKTLIKPVFSMKDINMILIFSKAWSRLPIFWRTVSTPCQHRISLGGSIYPPRFFCTLIPILYYGYSALNLGAPVQITQASQRTCSYSLIKIVQMLWTFRTLQSSDPTMKKWWGCIEDSAFAIAAPTSALLDPFLVAN